MKAELRYRTFEEVLASATTDVPHLQLENMIEPQQLIKVVTRINYELGLRINAGKVKLLELRHGKARLPADFAVANYAFLLEGPLPTLDLPGAQDEVFAHGVAQGLLLAQARVEGQLEATPATGAVFTQSLSIQPGANLITHGLHDENLLIQVFDAQGGTVLPDYQDFTPDSFVLFSGASVDLPGCTLRIFAAQRPPGSAPCREKAQVLTTGEKVILRYVSQSGRRQYYPCRQPLRFVRTRGVDADCQNLFRFGSLHQELHSCWLANNFLHTPTPEGYVALSYQSVLEDEEGSLLTLDHPKVNDYYEYALKEKIYESLWLSGEDVFQKLDYLQQRKLRPARTEALSFLNTPDFAQFRRTWELNRQAQLHRYYQLFR